MYRLDSFRNRLLFIFAGFTIFLGLCVSVYIAKTASAQLSNAHGQTLYIAAKNISNALGVSLAEREREIVLLSQSPFFAGTDLSDPRVRMRLEQVKNSYIFYAWMGVTDLQGNVQIAADGLLEGENVAARPWFKKGLQGTYIGDVHEAVMLAKKIPSLNPSEPMRLIDFATPMYDPNTKELKGVLAAHADWEWVRNVLDQALSDTANQKGIEIYIVNKNGEVLYPFQKIGRVTPPQIEFDQNPYFIHNWNEEQDYLTSQVKVVSNTKTDTGWHVVIRQPLTLALADIRELQFKIFLVGLIVSAFIFWIIYQLANKLSRPIEELARAAHAVEQGANNSEFKANSSIREVRVLAQSIESMTKTLIDQKTQLVEANEDLEKKVLKRTQELERANLELMRLARHDALTGLHNRRALSDQLEYLYRLFKRNQMKYSVLIIDIDHFKKVNDQHGHETGDEVLLKVAKVFKDSIRKTDFVARYGGEEFVVLLPSTELSGAAVLAEKIRNNVMHAEILAGLTISIGISEVDQSDRDVQDVLRRADQNLYQAKANGRNQVVA